MKLQQNNTQSKLLLPTEVADYLRVDYRKVLHLIQKKELKAIKVGKAYRIRQKDLDDYIWGRDRDES